MWSAIRYRRGQALVLLALAAVSTACAVLTPLYDRAMRQALTRQTVDGATSGDTTVEIRSVSRYAYGDDPDHRPAPHDELATLLPAPVRPWFTPRVDATSVQVVRVDRGAAPAVGPLLWRDGACEHLDWVAGGCPRERGDIAVSPADADNFGLAVGSVLRASELPTMALPTLPPPVPLRVTGIYRQVRGPYWAGQELTGVSGILGRQPPIRPLHDTWLTTEPTFSGDGWLDLGNSVTFPLDRSAVGVDEVTRTGTAVTAAAEESRLLAADFGYRSGAGGVLAEVRSGLPDIAATIERGRRQALVIVPLLTIQLGLLALFVLGLALAAAVEQRRPEVAVARLRGAGRAGGRRLVLAELVPVVLAGVPVGVVVALGLSAVARRTVLGGAAPYELPGAFWLAVAGAAVLVAAVAWATVAAGTRDRISALLRGVPARAPRWGLGAVDALVVAGAGTTVALFATGDLYGPVALAAPALLALGAGLVLAHLVVPVGSWTARRLTARGSWAAALAVLAVARRPATRRVVTVVTVASALLVFSAYAETVGTRNRQLAAERDTGAPTVADVSGTDVERVRSALATVPGDHATPVVRVGAENSVLRTTLAVDPADFGRIALFPDSDPAALPWSQLEVPTGRRLSLTGPALSARVTTDRLYVEDDSPVSLEVRLLDAAGRLRTVDLGVLPTDGSQTLGADVPCGSGCLVVSLSVVVPEGTAHRGRIRLDDVRAVGGSTGLPGTAADWTAGVDRENRVEAVPGGPGLSVEFEGDGATTPVLHSDWFPVPLPAVTAGPAGTGPDGTVISPGLDGTDRSMVPVGQLPRAPGVAGPVSLVDLGLLARWGTRSGSDTRIQVWLDTEDPAALDRVRAALARAGVEISGVRRLSEVRASLDASVPAWSLRLGVLAAVAGLLLAGLVLVLLAASTWRRRTRDLACLVMTGMPRRGLGRAATGEQLPVVLLAVLLGAGCGLLGAVLALPRVPLFARPRPAADLDLSTPWPVVLAALLAALVLLGLVSWLCGRAVAAAGARLSRVREVR